MDRDGARDWSGESVGEEAFVPPVKVIGDRAEPDKGVVLATATAEKNIPEGNRLVATYGRRGTYGLSDATAMARSSWKRYGRPAGTTRAV